MSGFKKQRVSEMLLGFLAEELRRLDNPVLALLTITGVDMSPDLKNAKIFWTIPAEEMVVPGVAPSGGSVIPSSAIPPRVVDGTEPVPDSSVPAENSRSSIAVDELPRFPSAQRRKLVEQALKDSTHFLKRRIASEMGLRYVPQLNFRYDESAITASRIDFLIHKAQTARSA